MAEASRCLSCPPEQTQAPLEACFALPTLELRPDCSRRSETNKHDVTLLWRTPPPRQRCLPQKRSGLIGPMASLHIRYAGISALARRLQEVVKVN